jgi:hypothetical protein
MRVSECDKTQPYTNGVRPFGVFIRIGPKVSFAATFGPTEGPRGEWVRNSG